MNFAANNELILDETHEFASIGNELLKKSIRLKNHSQLTLWRTKAVGRFHLSCE